jgi:hypothetical protein
MSEQILLTDFAFRWDENHILIRVGSRNGRASASPVLLRMIEEIEPEVRSLLSPRAVYTILPHRETNGHRIFDKAVQVALGISTIGPALEDEVERQFRDGDMLRGLLLDAFGTAAIVQIFKTVERRIVAEALGRGLWPGRRFSPGYRGWPLEEQRFVFSRVDATAAGVRLNESCMMIPRKSNSFRINLFADRTLTTRRLPGTARPPIS